MLYLFQKIKNYYANEMLNMIIAVCMIDDDEKLQNY